MSQESLLDALTSVEARDTDKKYKDLPELPDGQTSDELAVALNKSDDWVRTRLKALAAQGRLIIGKKKVKDLVGREVWVPAYKVRDESAPS